MTTANLEDMTDEELEAAQRAADGEASDTNPPLEDGTTTTADAAAQAGAPATDPATTTEAAADETAGADATKADAEPEKVVGVASKDGTRVLPYAALQSERRAARTANARYEATARELEEAKQLIADMKAGKLPDEGVSEADVIQMEEDFPDQGKKMRALYEQNKQLEASKPAPKAQAEEVSDDPIQDAIDQVPLLVEWQHGDPEKFERAQALDTALSGSRKWAGKPVIERFEHVAKLVAEEFDVPVVQTSSETKSKPSADPKKVIAQATRTAPNTLSDFKGGASPDHGNVNFEKLSPASMLDKFSLMTDAEMDAHLAKLG